jgi:hypothetical protein
MLEMIYFEMVHPVKQHFAQNFNSERPAAESFSEAMVKKSGLLEFYVSIFMHHLRVNGTHVEVEIYKKSAKAQMLKYINTN